MHNVTQGLMDLVSPTYDTRLNKTPDLGYRNFAEKLELLKTSCSSIYTNLSNDRYVTKIQVKVFLESSTVLILVYIVQCN